MVRAKHSSLSAQFISLFFVLGFSVALLWFTGCKRGPKRPADLPKLTPCTISVTFGGQKVDGVGILLLPEDPQANRWSASGRTDVEGKAKMITSSVFEGVVPGSYMISFQKNAEQIGTEPPPSVIPDKYTPGKSKEKIAVSENQKEYSFELETLLVPKRK